MQNYTGLQSHSRTCSIEPVEPPAPPAANCQIKNFNGGISIIFITHWVYSENWSLEKNEDESTDKTTPNQWGSDGLSCQMICGNSLFTKSQLLNGRQERHPFMFPPYLRVQHHEHTGHALLHSVKHNNLFNMKTLQPFTCSMFALILCNWQCKSK